MAETTKPDGKEKKVLRRDFLTGSGTAIAAGALAVCAPGSVATALAQETSAAKPPAEPSRGYIVYDSRLYAGSAFPRSAFRTVRPAPVISMRRTAMSEESTRPSASAASDASRPARKDRIGPSGIRQKRNPPNAIYAPTLLSGAKRAAPMGNRHAWRSVPPKHSSWCTNLLCKQMLPAMM